MKTLLSLYDHSGQWSAPFARAGWNVVQWDIKHVADHFTTHCDIFDACAEYIYQHIFDNFGTVDGIIAAQPCTDFASSGARWWAGKDADGTTDVSVRMAYITLAIIELCKPNFWTLENPIGRIHKLVKELGKPAMYFNPCDFGDPYTKKTALYGTFNTNLVKTPVEPTEGSKMWRLYGGKSERTKELRSVTPEGFANAFCDANKDWSMWPEDEELFEVIFPGQ